MWSKYLLLMIIGLCSGGVVAAGFFAFVTAIGIMTAYAQRTHTAEYIMRYEDAVMVGGIAGNAWWVLGFHAGFGRAWLDNAFFALSGLCYGIFVGSLVIGLAETIKAIPIFFRRVKITTGLAATIIAFAIGKSAGSLMFYLLDFAKK